MVYFANWKIVLVLLVCALGVIYAAPNLLGRSSATVIEQTEVAGTYGSFTINSYGRWTYAVDTGSAEFQALARGDSPTETFPNTLVDAFGAGLV